MGIIRGCNIKTLVSKLKLEQWLRIHRKTRPTGVKLFEFGLVEENVCRLCQKKEAVHLICVLETEFLTPEEVKKAVPKVFIRFFKGLKLEGTVLP